MHIYLLRALIGCGKKMNDVTRDYLQSLLRPEAWDVMTDAEGSQRYPDGSDWADPTAFPVHLRRLLGSRVEIYGFWGFENPTAVKLVSVAERHDFAVVDKRWLVDPWSAKLKELGGAGVLDLKSQKSLPYSSDIYGQPDHWERSIHLEQHADYQNAAAPSQGPASETFALDGIDML